MSHFYGMLQGNKGRVTRCGSRGSGLMATANGWNNGGSVEVAHCNGEDAVFFKWNAGSNGGHRECVGEFTKGDYDKIRAGTHRFVPARIEKIIKVEPHEDEGG